jgi:hypothetical protein
MHTMSDKVRAHSEGYAMRNALKKLMEMALYPVEISAVESA